VVSAPAGNLLLDETTHDLMLVNGNLVIASGDDAVRQAVLCRLLLFKGEWFMNEDIGIPYLGKTNDDRTSILGQKNPNMNMIKEVFRQAILNSPGIATVESISASLDRSTRLLTISFVAVQDSGARMVVDGFQVGA
jgi:hypothetical protein